MLFLALLTEAGWAASLAFLPWKGHVHAFLALYAGLFAVYLFAVRRALNRRVSFRWVFLAGALFRLTAFAAPPSLSDDVYRYLWDGRVQNAGIHPYRHAPDDPALSALRTPEHALINHPSVPTLYPPLSQLAFRAAAALRPSLNLQRGLFLLFDLALFLLLGVLLRARGLPAGRALIYGWHPLAVAEFASSGHLDSQALFWLMAGFLAWHSGRPLRSGVLWGLSFLSKLGSAVLAPWLLARREGRKALAALTLTVAAGYAAFLTAPLSETARALFSGTRIYARDWSFNAGLYAVVSAMTGASGTTLRLGAAALWLLFAVLLARRIRDPLAYAGLVVAGALALSPVVHPWYALWILPFLCFYPIPAGFAFTGIVALSYLVLDVYDRTGRWTLPPAVPWIEYGLTFLAFIGSRARPPEGDAPRRKGVSRPGIVIPARNEAKALPAVLAEIPRESAPEVVVADNGSSDGTADVARAGGARVVFVPRPGYGRAVQAGVAALSGDRDVVVVMDGDHSDYPADLPRLLEPLTSGEADFVIGSRVLGGAPRGSLTPPQRFGNWLACRLIALLWGRSFTDLGPFRALRRDLYDRLALSDPTFGWNVEMQIKALRIGARIREVPVRYRPRIGVSKISGTVKGTILAGTLILWTIARWAAAPDSKEKW